MSVFGISMVRDEADVIEGTLRRMAQEVDHLVVADNGSTDATREILGDLAAELPLTVVHDPEVGYFQSEKMSRLAAIAADMGAHWVIPHDADERWYSPFGRIGDVLAEHTEASIATARLYDHVATGADPAGPPMDAMAWRRRQAGALPKVACRPSRAVRIHQGNHGADFGGTLDGQLVVRHFPYRSAEQFVRKVRNGAAAYAAATGLPETAGVHWREYGRILAERGPDVLADEVFRRWFWVHDPTIDPGLVCDPCP